MKPVSFKRRLGIAVAIALTASSTTAKCVYDAELGEFRDSPALVMFLAFVLALVLVAYPLKDWAEENGWLAAALVLAAPVVAGLIGGGGKC
jgi:hypothetical protein